MKIDTTINIKQEVLEKIDECAAQFSISRSQLVSLLINSMIKENHTDKNRFTRVKYQKRDENTTWKRPHLMFEQDMYEKCIDIRKLLKLSVSFIVLVAFNRYIDKVVSGLMNGVNTDNNAQNYICIGRKSRGIYSYVIFWDFPPEKELIKFLE